MNTDRAEQYIESHKADPPASGAIIEDLRRRGWRPTEIGWVLKHLHDINMPLAVHMAKVGNPACETCGHRNHYAGVAALPGVPMSVSWCQICLALSAMPGMWWAVFKEDKYGEEVPRWFDHEHDCYRQGAELVAITSKDGRSWDRRGDVPDNLLEDAPGVSIIRGFDG